MSDCEDQQRLLQQLCVPDMLRKHRSVPCGWEIACSMVEVLAAQSKQAIAGASFYSISADEVTTIDHESWLSIHIYITSGNKRLSILLGLQRLVEGNGDVPVTDAIVAHMKHHGGLDAAQIAGKLVSFGVDGVSVFQVSRSEVTTQLKQNHVPFMIGVQCMAHRTNLAVQPISNLPIVAKLESLCQVMYSYFSASPKKHLEFVKLVDLMEIEGLKMLRNVKIGWISLLDSLSIVLGEYKTLIVKMCEDSNLKEPEMTWRQAVACESARLNYELLCDIGTLLALPYLMPLLESVNLLMKFSQSTHAFVSDYVATVKICQAELYMMYVDCDSSFQPSHFQQFCDVVSDHNFTISEEWSVDLNDGSESLGFQIGGHTYAAHKLCNETRSKLAVSRSDFEEVVASVKGQCEDLGELVIAELEKRFPDSDLMNALSILFPQFWLQANCDELFSMHMKTIQNHFCVPRSVSGGSKEEPEVRMVDPLFDAWLLQLQSSLFKLTMKSNSRDAMNLES